MSVFPELFATSTPPQINATNRSVAIDLAIVLHETGEDDRATALLAGSEQVIRGTPALLGDKSKAMAALREAEQAGWRGPTWRYYRDIGPNVASIRNEPEFRAVFADIERDIARQRTHGTGTSVACVRGRDSREDMAFAGTNDWTRHPSTYCCNTSSLGIGEP